MKRFLKMFVFILVISLFIQQTAFATEKVQPPKPTEGIESSNPKFGSSADINKIPSQSTSVLLSEWNCSISNTSILNLDISGNSSTYILVDQISLTLYLQMWDGTQWIDIDSWSFNNYANTDIYGRTSTACDSGFYYRTRGIHTAVNGAQIDTQYSTSTYIYIY